MKHLIIGNGVAGTTAALHIRKTDPEAAIQIITEESYPFYSRIRLPEFLSGETDENSLIIRKPDWYERNRITLTLSTRVTAIEPAKREVITSTNTVLSYDRLLVATGAGCFVPPLPGSDKKGVFTLRSMDDAKAIRAYAEASEGRVLLIGGGVLGLEAGYGIIKTGCTVTVVEVFPRLLPRQMDQEGAAILQRRMEAMGYTFHLGAKVKEIIGRDMSEALLLEDGSRIACDMIIISAGIRFNLDLVKKLGMTIDRGLVVNDRMETGVPGIYAAGDLIQHNGMCYGIWPAAEKQGEVAGINMAGGTAEYHGTTLSNTLKVAGIDLFSAGDIDADRKKEALVFSDHSKAIYKKLVLDHDLIIGAILLNDIRDRRKVMKAIEEKKDILAIRKQLETWDLSLL
jgi:nitrite reductase (NADH) large subunit